ncbi:hypothetical protein [Parasphingorhabdus sp.]|uniref:hypothetical protein n=1 Tax=Parasphingorhabdus sp. TaxID=2709688 RepID=UPI003266E4FF
MTVTKIGILVLAAISLCLPSIAWSQDGNVVIVTAQRSDYDYYDDEQSAIGLRRTADFFVQPLYVSSDSRDRDQRRTEVYTMMREAIRLARSNGIELVAGDYNLLPVTLENVEDLSIGSGRRPDTSRIAIYAKVPISAATKSEDGAEAKIQAYVSSVPKNGRSYIESGSIELAIRNPDQYRNQVVQAIATEARRYASYFGSDYGIEIKGLHAELSWTQISEQDVLLYIPHSFVIAPK